MRSIPILTILALAAGCARVDPGPAWEKVGALSQSRIEGDPVWVQSEEEAAQVKARVDALLEDGLTRDEAVRTAILNNSALQARFSDLGISMAGLFQASRYSNPIVDLWRAYPRSSGASSLGLIAALSDVWIVPRRKAVAEVETLQAQYAVALDVMVIAKAAALAWDRLVVAREELELAERILDIRRSAVERRAIRFSHGIDDAFVLNEARALAGEQEVAVQSARQMQIEAMTSLDRILAVKGASEVVPADARVTAYADNGLTLQALLEAGMRERLDLAIAAYDVERAQRRIGLEKALIWRSVWIGVTKEGNFDKVYDSNPVVDEVIGPTVSIELPIMDRNQGGRARAGYELQRAVNVLSAARMRATKELIDRHHDYRRILESLESLEETVLPAAQSQLEYTVQWNRKMQIPFVDVLAARERVITVNMEIARTRQALNDSWRMLQMAAKGGSM